MIAVDWEKVGLRIRQAMENKGYTCEQVAECCSGISYSTVQRLRAGKKVENPGIVTLLELCRVLEVPLTSLLLGTLPDEDLFAGSIEEIRQKRLSAEYYTGLSLTTVELLNHAAFVHGKPYIAELLDDFGFICDLERRLSGIALAATRLYISRSNTSWEDACKAAGVNFEDERKRPNLTIAGGMYNIESSIREQITKFLEIYLLGKGSHTAELWDRGEDNGNDPLENT